MNVLCFSSFFSHFMKICTFNSRSRQELGVEGDITERISYHFNPIKKEEEIFGGAINSWWW